MLDPSDHAGKAEIEAPGEPRFYKIFQTAPLSIAITRLRDGVNIEVNEAWEALTGYTRAEIAGKTTQVLNLFIHPEQRAKLIGGVGDYGRVTDLEVQLRVKSGETRDVLMTGELMELDGETCMLSMAFNPNGVAALSRPRKLAAKFIVM